MNKLICRYSDNDECPYSIKIGDAGILNDVKNINALENLLSTNRRAKSLLCTCKKSFKINAIPIFNILCNNTSLHKLSIKSRTLDLDNFRSLAKMLTINCTLQHLKLNLASLDTNDLRILADALHNNVLLEKLTLRNISSEEGPNKNFIDAEFISIIVGALTNNSNLQYLKIVSGSFEDNGALMIVDLLKTNTNLKILKLYNNGIGVKGIINLCNQSSLEYLDIQDDNPEWISYGDMELLSEVLCTNTSLTTLGIESNNDDYFWRDLIFLIKENYTIINIINLWPEENDQVIDFLNRNKEYADQARFKK